MPSEEFNLCIARSTLLFSPISTKLIAVFHHIGMLLSAKIVHDECKARETFIR